MYQLNFILWSSCKRNCTPQCYYVRRSLGTLPSDVCYFLSASVPWNSVLCADQKSMVMTWHAVVCPRCCPPPSSRHSGLAWARPFEPRHWRRSSRLQKHSEKLALFSNFIQCRTDTSALLRRWCCDVWNLVLRSIPSAHPKQVMGPSISYLYPVLFCPFTLWYGVYREFIHRAVDKAADDKSKPSLVCCPGVSVLILQEFDFCLTSPLCSRYYGLSSAVPLRCNTPDCCTRYSPRSCIM